MALETGQMDADFTARPSQREGYRDESGGGTRLYRGILRDAVTMGLTQDVTRSAPGDVDSDIVDQVLFELGSIAEPGEDGLIVYYARINGQLRAFARACS